MSSYTLKIETLTPVHIGDGIFLQKGSDFVTIKRTNERGEKYLINFVIDLQKVLACIGEEHLTDWMASIERHEESVLAFAKRFNRDIRPDDLSKRSIYSYVKESTPADDKTLKTCLHNGMGLPYIPGSSLKGAIRTAVLATLAPRLNNLENRVRLGNGFSAQQVESSLFGANPNSDVFRFLHVGDAYFAKDSEISMRMVNLNIRSNKDSLWDSSKSQLIEAIESGSESTCRLHLIEQDNLPPCMGNITELFKVLNEHTLKLLNEEVEYWQEVLNNGLTGAEDYIEKLKSIRDESYDCAPGTECVLRVGHGSGWLFITGAWCEPLNNFAGIVNQARPNNQRYAGYDFPKSRRLDKESNTLGFVKLSCIENN